MKKIIYLLLLLAECGISYSQVTYLFIGTYTDNKPAKGIYVYKLTTSTGKLIPAATGDSITNPSFLTIAPNGKYVYACTDTKTLLPGSVTAFGIDSITGAIKFINKQSSTGANPVYVAVDGSERFITVANYTGGSAAVLPVNSDGSVNAAVQSIQFTDSSINKARQEKSHIHSAYFSYDNRYVYLPDLGADKIRVFAFNPVNASPLTAVDNLAVKTVVGSGPRHMVFHPNNKFAYCIEEMSGLVAVYSYNKGKLQVIQKAISYQQQASEHSSADIHISPDGLFLYASNRVENTISIFSIDKRGMLKLLGHQSTMGDVPRNFCIDPTGNFLLVANQGANNVVVFRRNIKTGLLKETGFQISIPSPSCLQMRTYGVQ